MSPKQLIHLIATLLSLAPTTSQPRTCPAGDDTCTNPSLQSCEDTHPECAFWAEEGECANNQVYMQEHCPLSCNQCIPDVKGEECMDKVPSCPTWADQGECLWNPTYLGSACRKSCYLCFDETDDDEEYIRRAKTYLSWDRGTPQILGGSESERQKMKPVVALMESYSRNNLTTPESSSIRPLCTNAHESCVFWAATGECVNNPMFTMENCILACRACHHIEEFRRCYTKGYDAKNRDIRSPSFTAASWSSNTVSALKNAIRDDRPYNATFVSGGEDDEDPWILRFENFLTPEECDALIALGHDIGFTPSPIDPKEYPADASLPRREVQSAICNTTQSQNDSTYQEVLGKIRRLLSTARTELLPEEYIEHFEILQYQPMQSTGPHHDFRHHDIWRPGGPRILTFLLYLEDVEQGGATGFPELDWLFIQPKKGSALLWSNVLAEDMKKPNEKMVHEGLPVVAGVGYVMNVWVRLYDWKNYLRVGCP